MHLSNIKNCDKQLKWASDKENIFLWYNHGGSTFKLQKLHKNPDYKPETKYFYQFNQRIVSL